MACPTCDHMMQNLGATTDRIFWCPRCGTIRTIRGQCNDDAVPRWIIQADAAIKDIPKLRELN